MSDPEPPPVSPGAGPSAPAPPGARPAEARLRDVGRALRHRNYRLFFAGQGISLVGTWLTWVATSWLVYRLTHSALILGIVSFASQLPTFFLAPFAGVWLDRTNRHRVLVLTQSLAAIQSGLLAFFTLTGTIRIPHILVLGAFQGLINAVDMPARQAFVVEMVEDRADLPNAIALNSTMFNAARLIGPSIAGVLIALVGEGWCFFIDAVSYVAVIASLLAMHIQPRPSRAAAGHVLAELEAGFRYVAGSVPIRSILLLLALVSLFGIPYTVLMPVIVTQVLHGGPHTLGFLTAASGLGALAGALYLASRRSVLGLGRVVGIASITFGLALVAFSRSHWLALSLSLMPFIGASMIVAMASSNTILQTMVDENMRARVMSFFAMSFFGTAPLGSLFSGALANRIGASNTILVGGIVCLVAAIGFYQRLPKLRTLARPVYVQRGILPDISGPGAGPSDGDSV